MNYSPIIILLLAIAIDLAVGEPPEKFHLTVWIGKFIEYMERPFRRALPNEKVAGAALALVTITLFTGVTLWGVMLLKSYNWYIYIIVSAVLLKMTFAFRSMFKHVLPIMRSLNSNLDSSKKFLSKVVRRKTEDIDKRLVASGAVETAAEGFVDGFLSPMFFLAIFGLPGAVAYRAINTLDSMIAYKDARYINFGWLAAKLDTYVNYIPARLSYPIFVLSAMSLRLDWRGAISITRRDHGATKSVNAGWSMAPMAGALRVRLEKRDSYVIGDDIDSLDQKKIMDSLKVFALSSAAVMVALLALFIVEGALNYVYAF